MPNHDFYQMECLDFVGGRLGNWPFNLNNVLSPKNIFLNIPYSLARPTVATPHKFCTRFWQVSDKFDDCWSLSIY